MNDKSLDGADHGLQVEVCYALPERQTLVAVSVPEGATIAQAIEAAGLSDCLQEDGSVGVYGQGRRLSDPVAAGNRVEIYRPLMLDPKEARRLRAQS